MNYIILCKVCVSSYMTNKVLLILGAMGGRLQRRQMSPVKKIGEKRKCEISLLVLLMKAEQR